MWNLKSFVKHSSRINVFCLSTQVSFGSCLNQLWIPSALSILWCKKREKLLGRGPCYFMDAATPFSFSLVITLFTMCLSFEKMIFSTTFTKSLSLIAVCWHCNVSQYYEHYTSPRFLRSSSRDPLRLNKMVLINLTGCFFCILHLFNPRWRLWHHNFTYKIIFILLVTLQMPQGQSCMQ